MDFDTDFMMVVRVFLLSVKVITKEQDFEFPHLILLKLIKKINIAYNSAKGEGTVKEFEENIDFVTKINPQIYVNLLGE